MEAVMRPQLKRPWAGANESTTVSWRGGGGGSGGSRAAVKTAATCCLLLLLGIGLVGGSGGPPSLRSNAACERWLPGLQLIRSGGCPCKSTNKNGDNSRLLVARLRGGSTAANKNSLWQEAQDGSAGEVGDSDIGEYDDSDVSSSKQEESSASRHGGVDDDEEKAEGGEEVEKGRRVPTEKEQESANRQLEEIMADPELYRSLKNHTIDAFHDECINEGMTFGRLYEHFEAFLDIWYPDLEVDGMPDEKYFGEFGQEYFGGIVPFDQQLADEWAQHWQKTSRGRKLEEATIGDADAFMTEKLTESQQLRSTVTVPNDCDGMQLAVDMCADGGEVAVKRHVEEGRIMMTTDPILTIGANEGRRVTIRGDGGGVPPSAVDFWGRVYLDRESPGAIEGMRVLRDGPHTGVANDTFVSTMVVRGEWSMARCAVRASMLTAVSAGGRANLTMERCEVGGIGDAAGTEYYEKLKMVKLEDEEADAKVARAIGAAKKATRWHEVNKDDAVMEEKLRDWETNPEAVSREGDSMWDQAIKLMTEADAITEARLQEDPMDVREGLLAMAAEQGDFVQDAMFEGGGPPPEPTPSTSTSAPSLRQAWDESLSPAEAAASVDLSAHKAEALRTAGWVEVSSRCADAICAVGRASVRLTACTISLGALFAGALLRCGGRAGISATGVMLRDAGFSVSVHGDGSVTLDQCESRLSKIAPLQACNPRPGSALSISSTLIYGTPPWLDNQRPGSFREVDVRYVDEPSPFDGLLDGQLGMGGLDTDPSEALKMLEKEKRAVLENRLYSLQLGGEVDAGDARPGRALLFAEEGTVV